MLRRILAVCALLVVMSAPAQAHTDLVSSAPRDGQTLKKAPQSVTLTFGEDLLPGGDKLVAKDDAGARIDLEATTDGPRLSAPWPAQANAGTYKVAYRAVAADGHPLEGSITFTIAAPAQSPSPAALPAETPASASNPWLIAGPALLVLVLGAGGYLVWRSRE